MTITHWTEWDWVEILQGLFQTPLAGIFMLLCVGVLLVPLFTLWIRIRIVRKAGFSGILAFLWMLPIVGWLVTLYFAFGRWPIERHVGFVPLRIDDTTSQSVPRQIID